MKNKILVPVFLLISMALCGCATNEVTSSSSSNEEESSTVHEHSWGQGVVKTQATCTTNGVMLYTCDCGATRRESIPATGHDMEKIEKLDMTDAADGHVEHYHCKNCDKLFLDEEFIVDVGTYFGSAAYPFGNFNGTEYSIVSLDGNKAAKMQSTAYWPADLALSKEILPADVPAGEYVLSFDVLLSPIAKQHADQWSMVVAKIDDGPDGRVDLLNTKPGANNLGYNMLTTASDTQWTTFEMPMLLTGTYTSLKIEVYLWPEAYLNEPVYLDNFKVYAKDDAEKVNLDTLQGDFENIETFLEVEEDDVMLHHWNEGVVTTQPTCYANGVKTYTCSVCQHTKTESIAKVDHEHVRYVPETDTTKGHFECSDCGDLLVYDLDKITTLKPGQSKGPFTNTGSGANDFFIEALGDNAVGTLRTENGWPETTTFTKRISDGALKANTSYTLTFDVKLGSNNIVEGYSLVGAVNFGNSSQDILNTKPDANAQGYNFLHNCSSESWTTFEANFTSPSEIGELRFSLFLWSEVANGGFIYVDNIRIYEAADDTKTNVDQIPGDFEGLAPLKKVTAQDLAK